MKPEIVLSLFNFHLFIVGTPRGAVETDGFAGEAATAILRVVVSSFGSPNPNNDNVGLEPDGRDEVCTSFFCKLCFC